MDHSRNIIRRLTRLGVSAEMPPADVKHVVLTNQFALFAVLGFVSYGLWNLLVLPDHPARTIYGLMEVAGGAVAVLPLVLNARGQHLLAVAIASICCVIILAGGTILLGLHGEVHYYLAFLAVLPFHVFRRRDRMAAVALAVAVLAAFVLLLAFCSEVPVVGEAFAPDTIWGQRLASASGLYVMFMALGYYAIRNTERAEDEVEEQRARAERLLLSILPKEIATRLKAEPTAIADRYDDVTVLFADIAGFTPLSEKLEPDEVVGFLNQVFSEFDRLTEKHGLEKIKTIGDAYMVAGGLPEERPDHATAMAEFSLDMVESVSTIATPSGDSLSLRVGMNTGPAVAGVIGKKKFSYDLWGDTVNLASRMESHGALGEIQVTKSTYERLKDRYELVARGPVDIKGKGRMETWWLRGRKGGAAVPHLREPSSPRAGCPAVASRR